MPKQPETTFKEKVLKDLKALRNEGGAIWFFKSQEIAVRGILDVIVCLNGAFWSLELKKDEHEKPDALQAHNIDLISNNANGVALVVHPKNWEKIFKTMRRLALQSSQPYRN